MHRTDATARRRTPLARSWALALPLLLVGCATQRPIDQVRESGDRAFNQGEYATASAEYGEIIERYPGDWQAQFRYGQVALELGDWDTARSALKIAHDQRPSNPDIADAYAEALIRCGDDQSLLAFLRERTQSEGDTRSWIRLAHFSERLRDPDAAMIALETAIEIGDERVVNAYIAAADLAERLGDTDTAIRRLRQAYGVDPGNEEVSERLRRLGEVPGPTIALPPGR